MSILEVSSLIVKRDINSVTMLVSSSEDKIPVRKVSVLSNVLLGDSICECSDISVAVTVCLRVSGLYSESNLSVVIVSDLVLVLYWVAVDVRLKVVRTPLVTTVYKVFVTERDLRTLRLSVTTEKMVALEKQ